jgi:hypothetical protein
MYQVSSPQVGPTGWPNGRSYLSPKEERAHFALWALLKSPLFVAADLRQLSPASLATLTAREVIALNQDPLGVPGDLVWKQGPKEVYATPLADGGRGVVLFNRHSVLSQVRGACSEMLCKQVDCLWIHFAQHTSTSAVPDSSLLAAVPGIQHHAVLAAAGLLGQHKCGGARPV